MFGNQSSDVYIDKTDFKCDCGKIFSALKNLKRHNYYGINTISFSRSAFVRKDDVLHSITVDQKGLFQTMFRVPCGGLEVCGGVLGSVGECDGVCWSDEM